MSVLDTFALDGKCAIVTGGSQGIGNAIATALADAGASVVVTNRSEESGRAAAEAISEETDGTAVAIPSDVREEASVAALVDEVVDRFGGVEVLVNSAGIALPEPAEEKPLEQWDRTIETNLTGAFLCSKHVGRAMIDGDGGSIINVSSISAFVADQHVPHVDYHASKGGLEAMTRQLASEWGPHGVRVNTLAPGFVRTDLSAGDAELDEHRRSLIPLEEIATPQDLVGAAVFLASEASAYVTGTSLLIDGGFTIR